MVATLNVSSIQAAGSTTPNIQLDVYGNAIINNATLSPAASGTNTGNVALTGTVAMGSSFKRNRIINGNIYIDQRNAGAAITPSGTTYCVDRWRANLSQASKMTFQQQTITQYYNCENNKYTLACQTASAYSVGASDYFGINQFIEGYNVADLGWGGSAAKSVTLSFWVYCGLTGTFGGAIRTGDSSNYSYPFTYTISAANAWEKKTITIPGPTAGTWGTTNGVGLDVWFSLGTGSTFAGPANAWAAANYVCATGCVNVVGTASGSGGNWYITGVQLEQGSVATPYEKQIYSDQLAQCQRYLPYFSNTTVGNTYPGIGPAGNTTTAYPLLIFPVTARVSATGIVTSGAFALSDAAATTNATSLALNTSNTSSGLLTVNVASGLTQFRTYFLQFPSNGYIYFTGCEL